MAKKLLTRKGRVIRSIFFYPPKAKETGCFWKLFRLTNEAIEEITSFYGPQNEIGMQSLRQSVVKELEQRLRSCNHFKAKQLLKTSLFFSVDERAAARGENFPNMRPELRFLYSMQIRYMNAIARREQTERRKRRNRRAAK